MNTKSSTAFSGAVAIALALAAFVPPLASPQDRLCDAGQVPIPWPLGDNGFQARRVLTSHGQYLDLPADDLGDDWPPFIHRGIDVWGCVGDMVYAIEEGEVEYVSYDEVEGYNQVVIADDDEDDVGWSYLHLDKVFVGEGDVVKRDQAIGTLVAFPRWGGYDHLHLQRVAPSYGAGTSMEDGQCDAGNPLPRLIHRAENAAPRVLAIDSPVDAPVAALIPFRFCKNTDPSTVFAPDELGGETVDVLARVEEIFPGTGKPFCPPLLCDGKEIAHEIMPMRLSFSIFQTVDAEPGTGPSGPAPSPTVRDLVFHNVLEFDKTFLEETGTILDVFQADTISTYTQRKFVIVLTHCQETGSGSFSFESNSEYLVQLVVEDASSNATVREMTIDIP